MFRKIKKVIDKYCKQGIYYESEFQEINKQIVEYQDKVDAFVNRRGAEEGLSLELKNRMQQNHNPKLNEIKKIVHESEGIVTTEAAMLIEDNKYLNEYAEKVNKNGLHNQLYLFQHRQGITFAMGLAIYKCKVCLEFPSTTVIKYFEAPDPEVNVLGIKNIIREPRVIKPSGEEDETVLFLAGSELLKKRNLKLYRPSFTTFMNYVKKRENNVASEDRTKISSDRYHQLISKTVFLKSNDQVATMTKEEVVTAGIHYLKSLALENTPDISWPSLKKELLVMQDIYTDLQI